MKELNHHKQALEQASENSEANEKISRPGTRRLVRPLTQTGQTGRAGIKIPDRSDRFHRPVRPVAPRQPANKARKRSPNPSKLGGYLHICPVNISPRDLSQKIKGS